MRRTRHLLAPRLGALLTARFLSWTAVLTVVCAVALVVASGAEAHTLSYTRCQNALYGSDGSDNDIAREMALRRAVRASWGGAVKVDAHTVVQILYLRQFSGLLVQTGYVCKFTSSTGYYVADWVWWRS